MTEIFVWLVDSICMILWYGFLYVLLPILALRFLWPYISGVVKFLAIAVPAVIVVGAFCWGSVGLGFMALLGAAIWYVILWVVTRFLDGTFGVLVSEEEAMLEDMM